MVATTVEMLSGRRKRDYEAESLASQAAGEGESITSEGEASELIGSTDGNRDEARTESSGEDEQVLVLA